MTKARKRVLIVLLAAALLIAAGGVFAAWYTGSYQSYSRCLALGEKYLSEEDYPNAVLAYQKAIRLAPDDAEGYIGLVRVYQSRGSNILAQTVLRTGIDRTDSPRLKLMLETMTGTDPAAGTAAGGQTDKGPEAFALNTGLLSLIGSSCYNDYRLRNGIESTEMTDAGTCAVRVTGVAADLIFRDDEAGTLDHVGGQPAADNYPAEVHLDDLAQLFSGVRQVTVEMLRSQNPQDFAVSDNDDGTRSVTFTAAGCFVTLTADADGSIQMDGPHSLEPGPHRDAQAVSDAPETSGRVVSATTGSGVARAEVRVRSGSLTSGEPLQTVTTDSFGHYTLTLDAGPYTAEVICSGYTTETFEIYVSAGGGPVNDLVISPLLSEGQMRIVLEWGGYPSDLDSHLDGTLDDGTAIHVDYTNRTASRGGERLAALDVDDVDGYGPETTTVYNMNGVFRFSVEDYLQTGDMSGSGATVKVYLPGNSVPQTIEIPSGLGNIWYVCTIDHGTLSVTNHG